MYRKAISYISKLTEFRKDTYPKVSDYISKLTEFRKDTYPKVSDYISKLTEFRKDMYLKASDYISRSRGGKKIGNSREYITYLKHKSSNRQVTQLIAYSMARMQAL